MSLADQADADWELFDETETVSVGFDRGGSVTTVAGVTALMNEKIDSAFVTSAGIQLTGKEVAMSLRASTITGGNIVSIGDTVTDSASVVYRIKACNLRVWKTSWYCVTVPLR